MDRKAWIIILLCLAGFFWTSYSSQKRAVAAREAEQREKATKAFVTARATNATATPAPAPALEASPNAVATVTQNPEAPIAAAVAAVPATTKKLRSKVAEYTFTSEGGIKIVDLLNHKADGGGDVILNATSDTPIGAITEKPGTWPKTNATVSTGVNSITLESTQPDGLQVKKTFTIGAPDLKDDYQIKLEVAFSNPGVAQVDVKPWFVNTGAASPIHPKDQATYLNFDYQAGPKTIYKNVQGTFNGSSVPLVGIQLSDPKEEFLESASDILWAGTKNQYFATMLQPLGNTRGTSIWATRYELPHATDVKAKPYAITGALGFPAFSLKPGETKSQSFAFYAGPKEFSRLKKLGADQQNAMEFGFFGIFSSTLLQAMNWIHQYVGNYGVAILLLTLIIKSGLWTIQNKSMKSMKKMSLLGPKMTELKEKHKADPARMNQEVMKLYKDYGVNPFAGCLPMLVQMPIFFGFYRMLAVAVELRNSSFLWVHDLSQPDTVAHISGFPINIFPIVMGVSMLWQMQLTPKTGDSSQQKIFMFMPIFFLFICYNYASALALYWTVQNIFSIVQLYLTRNAPLPELVKVNAIPAGAKPAKRR